MGLSLAMRLEGFTQFGHNVEKNYKIDEMIIRDDFQIKLKGLRFIWPKER